MAQTRQLETMALNLIMLGAPGAGKGTQAERFARDRGDSEDLDRRHPAGGGARRARSSGCGRKAIMDRGELVSDDVMIGIVRERLDRPDADGRLHPRRVSADGGAGAGARRHDERPRAARSWSTSTCRRRSWCGGWPRGSCAAQCGANATAPPAEAASLSRATCGGQLVQRADDNEAVVLERLEGVRAEDEPLIDYYRAVRRSVR